MIDYPTVERALRSADPEALPETLRAVLLTMGVGGVEVHLADLGLRVLTSVGSVGSVGAAGGTGGVREAGDESTAGAAAGNAEVLPIHASVQGRAFAGQQPQYRQPGDGTTIAIVPVSVRGERHGTLTARLPAGGAGPAEIETLQAVATLLGHEIVVAERDTDRYQQTRRSSRLTLAAETQWQLLPGRSSRRREYALGAQLEPAYAIRGDGYDWAATGTGLALTVVNGMGEGMEAALLTSLAVNALRNARRADLDLADQAALADQAVYAQHRGDVYISALLLSFAYDTGQVTVVDAGSPQIWLRRGRSIERIAVEPQLPLGMFEETAYSAQSFQVLPGDRLVIVSDGVHTAVSPGGEAYGDRTLQRSINSSGLLPAAEVPTAILRELSTHRSADAEDDAIVVCLDWYGGSAE